MDQYLLIPFFMGWTSIYQLFWCELQGYYWFWHIAIWKINEHNHQQQQKHVITWFILADGQRLAHAKGEFFSDTQLGSGPTCRLYKNTERSRQKSGGAVGEIWSWLQLVTGTSCQPCNRNRLRTEVPTILFSGLYFFSDPDIPIMAVVGKCWKWGTEIHEA